MGTNYYLMTRDKELVNKYFPNETTRDCYDCGYEIVDSPYLGYQIHINKLSWGWKPLFQIHSYAFKSFNEFEKFYNDHYSVLEIYDEYDKKYTFEEYKQILLNHLDREPKPLKWVYEVDKLFGDKPSLHTKECTPEEAEIWIPFDHKEYARTECIAREKFKVPLPSWMSRDPYSDTYYTRDPDYKFDWVRGDFS